MVKNKILVVAGMHRSGTSVVTQWLKKCGLNIGDELMGAETGNEQGHFEDVDFLRGHQSLLRRRRVTDTGFTDPVKQITDHEKELLNDIINHKNSFSRQWGWKDPRTCLFLDAYRELIPEAFYFVVLRNHVSVVSSLIRRIYNRTEKKYASRKGISKFIWERIKKKRRMKMLFKKHSQHYLKVWIAYNEAILQHLKQVPQDNYLVIDYRSLYNNDKEIFDLLTHQCGFELEFFQFKNIYKDSLMHPANDISEYVKDKSLLGWAAAIEASMKQLSIFNNKQQVLEAV